MFTFIFHYKNGQSITLSERISYDSLDRRGIESCEVQKDGNPFFILHFEANQKPIYRRRVEKQVGGGEIVCYLLGWHDGSTQSINYIFDDVIHQAGRFREDHRWFYSPKMREFER